METATERANTATAIASATRIRDGAAQQDAARQDAAGQIRIERLILHGLDNRAGRLELVDEPVLLDEEIVAFFALYIKEIAARADWRAQFAEPLGEAATLCQELLGDGEAFVAASQGLARRLFAQMGSRVIAPGDLVVMVYTRDGERPTRHIALLKLEPDQRLGRVFQSIHGQTRARIEAIGNLLPDMKRLQKCALLTATSGEDGESGESGAPGRFAIQLLDTQATAQHDGVASYFYRGFLDAQLEPSPRRHTRTFLRVCDQWLRQRSNALAPAELLVFFQARRRMLGVERLDCQAFVAEALPTQTTLAAELLSELHRGGLRAEDHESGDADGRVARGFAVDRAIAAPLLARIVLELDGGARLIVPAGRFADLVRVTPTRGANKKITLTIQSLTISEITDR